MKVGDQVRASDQWPDLRGERGVILNVHRGWAEVNWIRLKMVSWMPVEQLEGF